MAECCFGGALVGNLRAFRGELPWPWQMLDVSVHERRRGPRKQDLEYHAAYERAAGELAQTVR